MVVFNYLRNKLIVEISQRCKVLGLVQETNLAHFPVTNIYSTEREKGGRKSLFLSQQEHMILRKLKTTFLKLFPFQCSSAYGESICQKSIAYNINITE